MQTAFYDLMRSDVAAADVGVTADADVKHMLRFFYREVVRLQKNWMEFYFD